METVVLSKDDAEHPVPEIWRSKFRQIAAAFAADDFQLRDHHVEGVMPIEGSHAEIFRESANAYGDSLAPLNDATWKRSIYRWMDGHWQFLVDLTTSQEPVSDLALHARLDEASGQLRLDSLHVP